MRNRNDSLRGAQKEVGTNILYTKGKYAVQTVPGGK